MQNFQGYDTKIVVQVQSESSRTAANEPQYTWATHATLWGRRRYRALGESDRMEQLASTQEVMFNTRYTAGITTVMRILVESEYYQITKVEPMGRKESLVITAIKKDAWT
jgi:SPP1 family predicted phage head-tail adaptor